MRAFLDRLAANAGSALAAGATVLAVGAALGAVGLADAQRQPGSPFGNPWVIAGVGIIALAALWTVGVFIIAMVATAKAVEFRILLGHALNDGEALEDEGVPEATIREWGQQALDLIEAGLGPAEGRLFLSDYDIDATFGLASNLPGHVWLERRVRRLTRLMDRMQGVQVGPGAKLPKPWKYRSSKRVPDAKYASERDESGDSQ